MFEKKPIKITQHVLSSGYRHLETILLIDDKEATRLSDWVVGYFHCRHCDAYEAYANKLPPAGSVQVVVPKMHNQRNAFFRKHHHGDGRIILFEKDMEEARQENKESAKTVEQQSKPKLIRLTCGTCGREYELPESYIHSKCHNDNCKGTLYFLDE